MHQNKTNRPSNYSVFSVAPLFAYTTQLFNRKAWSQWKLDQTHYSYTTVSADPSRSIWTRRNFPVNRKSAESVLKAVGRDSAVEGCLRVNLSPTFLRVLVQTLVFCAVCAFLFVIWFCNKEFLVILTWESNLSHHCISQLALWWLPWWLMPRQRCADDSGRGQGKLGLY